MEKVLRDAYEAGVILAGLSAGAICWFEQGLTASTPGTYTKLECLGLLSGSCSPHYDVESNRRLRMHDLVGSGKLFPGYGIENSCAIHYSEGEISRVISSVEGKAAYQIFLDGEIVKEEKIPADLLE